MHRRSLVQPYMTVYAGSLVEPTLFESCVCPDADEVDLSKASLNINTVVRNMANATTEYKYTLRHTLKDAKGNEVSSCEAKGTVLNGKQEHLCKAHMTVENPHLLSRNGLLGPITAAVTGHMFSTWALGADCLRSSFNAATY